MNRTIRSLLICLLMLNAAPTVVSAQQVINDAQTSLYDVPPRWLVDMPTAGTLPRAYYSAGFRFYPNGGCLAYTNIGLSNRLTLGISYGAENILSNRDPNWNPQIQFNVKFRVVDEIEVFPAVTFGFCSQGFGAWISDSSLDRYTFKSRGFYAVVSRSFYFYNWTSGWHAGVNYSLENEGDDETDPNVFVGFDATFQYNLAVVAEFDAALDDNKSKLPNGSTNPYSGKGRGYLNTGIKWLVTENLELEFLLKDLLINRRDSDTFTRSFRLTYLERF
ncbi:MAG: hypothetical protein OEV49_07720 [candidate division Zixibacteria bacterium]|nr:hypothetical protein [candidate division Zixibacteria bacterium]MDH3936763.1 hypothetical protein [candidate division Zixibacteria bacterium]MDH4032785.1 hypothetical protein [candidate division Zixibacteria bacterium]